MSGEFDHYTNDPYIDNAIKREPLKDDVEIVIIGGGFGGLISVPDSGNSAMRVSASSRGRRLWRDLVLEQVLWRGLRHRSLHLFAASRGGRLCAHAKVRARS